MTEQVNWEENVKVTFSDIVSISGFNILENVN